MKFRCTCGNVVRDQLYPNPVGLRIVTDGIFEDLASTGAIDADAVFDRASRALRCETCGRVYIFWKKGQWPPEEFVPVKPDGTIPGYVLIEPADKPK